MSGKPWIATRVCSCDPDHAITAGEACDNRPFHGSAHNIDKAMDLALQLEVPAPALGEVNELEAKRQTIAEEIGCLERDHSASSYLFVGKCSRRRAAVFGAPREAMRLAVVSFAFILPFDVTTLPSSAR